MVSIIMRQWILFTLSPSFLSVSSSMRQHAGGDVRGFWLVQLFYV
jgi:hypothetical protein